MTRQCEEAAPGQGGPLEIAGCGTQQADSSDARRRRACVEIFVSVIAEHRPKLTDDDLDDLRAFLLARSLGGAA